MNRGIRPVGVEGAVVCSVMGTVALLCGPAYLKLRELLPTAAELLARHSDLALEERMSRVFWELVVLNGALVAGILLWILVVAFVSLGASLRLAFCLCEQSAVRDRIEHHLRGRVTGPALMLITGWGLPRRGQTKASD
jgi:hypothetical protein